MDFTMPGSFIFPSRKEQRADLSGEDKENKTPTKSDGFKFNTSLFDLKAPLYPSLDPKKSSESTGFSFNSGIFTKTYPTNVTKSVLEELNTRVKQVENTAIQNSPRAQRAHRRKSSRFSSAHQTKFKRMDSIASHYAASRKTPASFSANGTIETGHRAVIENVHQRNEMKNCDNSKRNNVSQLESAAKRRRTNMGATQEVTAAAPVKSVENEPQSRITRPAITSARKAQPLRTRLSSPSTSAPTRISRSTTMQAISTPGTKRPTLSNSVSSASLKLQTEPRLPRCSTSSRLSTLSQAKPRDGERTQARPFLTREASSASIRRPWR
ncbi:unnamed protein product [Kuraishia capsulata CBS 1993]|uniref:Uncharacterized protein n=1 Tax=Kuraishia capsulata CBS 1993 TaxID=1382522 RepID=W6MQJ5_9ASCO|nr:uncharacterized protein KUCA_T00004587001 [Kuraishia capsulata CBS 1993]CDK28603.1 unnamed protein product [Kuraishia capsulata CBS 1993]